MISNYDNNGPHRPVYVDKEFPKLWPLDINQLIQFRMFSKAVKILSIISWDGDGGGGGGNQPRLRTLFRQKVYY